MNKSDLWFEISQIKTKQVNLKRTEKILLILCSIGMSILTEIERINARIDEVDDK